MKRKIMALALSLILCASIIGCGKSEIVTTTENAISDIGEVTIDSKDKIEAAEGYYNALTDKQKEQVGNASKLVEARSAYDKLEEESNAKADAEITEEEEIALLYLLYYAKGLKNPRSLKVYDVWVSTSLGANVVATISAENSFGGTVETTIGTDVGFMIIEEGDTWEDAISEAYEYESYLGVPNYWAETDTSSRIVNDDNRLDSERIQKFYDENVYRVQ